MDACLSNYLLEFSKHTVVMVKNRLGQSVGQVSDQESWWNADTGALVCQRQGIFPSVNFQCRFSYSVHTAHVCSHRHQRYVLCANTKNPKHRQPLHCSGTNKQTNKQKAKMQMLVGKGSYHLQGINEVSTRNGKSTLQYFDFSGCPCKHTGAPSWKTFWFQWVPIQAHSPKIMWFQWVFIQAHSQKILCSHWYYNSNLYCTELTCV